MDSIKKNTILNIIKTIMTIIFPIISFPYASRILGVEKLGAVQYAASIISYMTLIAGLGIGNYAVREGSRIKNDRKKLSRFSSEVFVINLISTICVYLVLFLILFFNVFKINLLLILVSSLSIIGTTFTVDWIYQLEEDYPRMTLRSIVAQGISLILLFSFVKTPNDYIVYAFTQIVASVGYCVVSFWGSKRYVDLSFKIQWKSLIHHLKPIILIFSISIASAIYLNLDTVMLGVMRGNYEVGLYSVAVKVTSIIRMLITSIGVVVLPRLSYFLHLKKLDEYHSMLKTGVNINLLFSIPCAIGMYLLSKDIIIIFSGASFLAADFSSKILSINMIFSVIDNLLYYQVLLPFRMEKLACLGTVSGAISNVILNYFLIEKYSVNGAAIATLISECIVFIIFLFLLRKTINILQLFCNVWKYLLSAVIMGIICYWLMSILGHGIFSVIVEIGISIIVYFLILFCMKIPELSILLKRGD